MAVRDSTRSGKRSTSHPCQERRLKVYSGYYAPRANASYAASRPVPWVQLKGYWLEQAGFTISAPIRVRVMDGCLVLTTLAQEEESGDTPVR